MLNKKMKARLAMTAVLTAAVQVGSIVPAQASTDIFIPAYSDEYKSYADNEDEEEEFDDVSLNDTEFCDDYIVNSIVYYY